MEQRRLRPHVARGPERARSVPHRAHAEAFKRPPAPSPPRRAWLLRATRHWLPGLIVSAGVIVMAFDTETALATGAALIGAGLATWLSAWLYRVGIEGEAARYEEENARRRFTRTGRWS